jgi:hypothetical protein
MFGTEKGSRASFSFIRFGQNRFFALKQPTAQTFYYPTTIRLVLSACFWQATPHWHDAAAPCALTGIIVIGRRRLSSKLLVECVSEELFFCRGGEEQTAAARHVGRQITKKSLMRREGAEETHLLICSPLD